MVSLCPVLLTCALLALTAQGLKGDNIAVNTVSVDSQDGVISITVTYTAGPETYTRWSKPRYRNVEDLVFEEDNFYADGEGRSTVRVTHEEATKHNSRDFLRYFFLHNAYCRVELTFLPFSRLIALSPRSQDFRGLALTMKKGDGQVLEPGTETAFEDQETAMNIIAVLSSPELPRYSISGPIVTHTRLQNDSGGAPERKWGVGYEADVDMNTSRHWTGNSTTKGYTTSLGREDSSRGILRIENVYLERRSRADDTLVTFMFTRVVYIALRRGDDAIPMNTVALYSPKYRQLTEYDMVNWSKFHIQAIGNPLPTIKLFRACSGLIPSEVELYTQTDSKYQVTFFFKFKNFTHFDAVKGSYTFAARSGLMEVREHVSVGTWS